MNYPPLRPTGDADPGGRRLSSSSTSTTTMAGWLQNAKGRAQAFAGRDALDWVDKAYILDWSVDIYRLSVYETQTDHKWTGL